MKPHRTDLVSLLAGLGFLGIAALWVTSYLVPLDPARIGAMVAAGLVVLGAVGVVYTLTASRRPR